MLFMAPAERRLVVVSRLRERGLPPSEKNFKWSCDSFAAGRLWRVLSERARDPLREHFRDSRCKGKRVLVGPPAAPP